MREAVARLGDRLPGRWSIASSSVARVREQGLAGALPVRRPRAAVRLPLRRGRLRRNRARDPASCWACRWSRWPPCAPRTRRGPGWYPRPPISRAPTRGPYEAGGVWAVLSGRGRSRSRTGAGGDRVQRDGRSQPAIARELRVTHPGAYPLIEHPRHTAGLLGLRLQRGVVCHATCFTPGAGRRLGPDRSRPARARRGALRQQPLEHAARPRPRRARMFRASRGSRRASRPRKTTSYVQHARSSPGARRSRAASHSASRRRGSGPARCVWPKTT